MVVDDSGVGVSGASVLAVDSAEPEIPAGGCHVLGATDARGRLQIHSAASAFIAAEKRGFVSAAVRNDGDAMTIVLRPGHVLNVTLVELHTRTPVPGARLTASRWVASPRESMINTQPCATIGSRPGARHVALSDPHGHAALQGLSHGRYTVSAHHETLVAVDDVGDGGVLAVPGNGGEVRLTEPVVYALGCSGAPVLSWRYHHHDSGLNTTRLLHRCATIASGLRQRWPNSIIHVAVADSPEPSPPALHVEVLHTDGIVATDVPPVPLSRFVAPIAEHAPPSGPLIGARLTVRAIAPDGIETHDFDSYVLSRIEDGGVFHINVPKHSLMVPIGRYHVAPKHPLESRDFDPMTFDVVVGAEHRVRIPLKHRLLRIRFDVARADGAPIEGYMIGLRGDHGRPLQYFGPVTHAWIPETTGISVVARAFGFKPIDTSLPLADTGPGVLRLRFDFDQ
jgi:hypothetical protein